jgi:pyruvate formate lyase activating enzyme
MPPTGTIFDIKKYAIHDGPGIRTTVFFKGCPLDCWWCHNPESRHTGVERIEVRSRIHGADREIVKEEIIGREVTIKEVMTEVLKDVIFYDQSGGGVTFSGGEPLHQIDFLTALLQACKDHHIHTAVDTSGCAPPEDFARINGLVDLYLYDLKLMDEQIHVKLTGASNQLILENLSILAQHDLDIQVRVPLIPGITDTEENLDAILAYLDRLNKVNEVCLLPYNVLGENKRRKFNLPQRLEPRQTQSKDMLEVCAGRFRARGYLVHVGG